MRIPEYVIEERPTCWVLSERIGEKLHPIKVFYFLEHAEKYKVALEQFNESTN